MSEAAVTNGSGLWLPVRVSESRGLKAKPRGLGLGPWLGQVCEQVATRWRCDAGDSGVRSAAVPQSLALALEDALAPGGPGRSWAGGGEPLSRSPRTRTRGLACADLATPEAGGGCGPGGPSFPFPSRSSACELARSSAGFNCCTTPRKKKRCQKARSHWKLSRPRSNRIS